MGDCCVQAPTDNRQYLTSIGSNHDRIKLKEASETQLRSISYNSLAWKAGLRCKTRHFLAKTSRDSALLVASGHDGDLRIIESTDQRALI
eukprot:scaffold112541_cov50-Prasinocladus_malaysianus.AAC.1